MDEMDFQLLSALNETHNITKAANLLFMTQSAVSRRISALEEELGVVLITRTKQGIHFTSEGETVFHSAQNVLKELADMREKLLMHQGVVSGTLNLGVTNNYATFQMAQIIAAFHQRYPFVKVNIITDHSRKIANRLTTGNIDLGIARGEQDWSDGKILLRSESICAIRNAADQGKDLQELPYIERITSQHLTRSIAKWLRENNLPRISSNIAAEHIITCVQMVEQGVGWAIVPDIALSGFTGISTPLLYQDGTPLVHNTWLLYPSQNLTLPAVRVFVEFMQELFEMSNKPFSLGHTPNHP